MKSYSFFLAYVIPISVIVGYDLGGIYTFLTPFFCLVILPIIDLIGGVDRTNPKPEEMAALEKKLSYRIVPILYVPLQVGLVVWGAYALTHKPLSSIECIGLVLSIGTSAGEVGFAVAHELFHKRSTFAKWLGKILLMTSSYMHFYIEHRIGHHVNVGTPKDPSSARLGESFYKFYPRTIINSMRSAWGIEERRLRKLGVSKWSFQNQMIWFTLLPVTFAGGLGVAFGWQAIAYFFIQSIIAFSILEVVNYIEHYGLERREVSPDRFEKVSPMHAWEANQRISNYFFFKLQRHADHHLHPVRSYHVLRSYNESPQFPTGYAGMALLALVPPLWQRIMDPIVYEYRKIEESPLHSNKLNQTTF